MAATWRKKAGLPPHATSLTFVQAGCQESPAWGRALTGRAFGALEHSPKISLLNNFRLKLGILANLEMNLATQKQHAGLLGGALPKTLLVS
jgi:hypothetical protein